MPGLEVNVWTDMSLKIVHPDQLLTLFAMPQHKICFSHVTYIDTCMDQT